MKSSLIHLSLDLFKYEGAVIKQICSRIQINYDFEYLIAIRDGGSIGLLVITASALDSFQMNDLIDYFVSLDRSLQDYHAKFLSAKIILISLLAV